MGWGRTRARSLARAGARAAGTGDAALPGSAAPPVGAQRVHSVPQSTRWPRAARSTLRLVRRRTDAHRTGKGVNPSNKAGAHRSNSAKHDPGCGRAVGHAVQGHPHRNPLGWVAARTPAARVGLHQTLANSRETIHTIPRNALARARPAPIEQFQLEPGRARPPRLPKHRATRCRAPRASCCPLDTLGAPEAGRARCGSPPSLAPCGARARPVCHEYAGADSLGRARCSPATGAAGIAPHSAAPVSAVSHALLHAWSTKGRPHRKKRPARPDCAGGAHVRTALAALLILRGWLGGGERARPLLHGGTWAAQEEEACGRIILGSTVRIPSAGGRIHSGACGHRGTALSQLCDRQGRSAAGTPAGSLLVGVPA